MGPQDNCRHVAISYLEVLRLGRMCTNYQESVKQNEFFVSRWPLGIPSEHDYNCLDT